MTKILTSVKDPKREKMVSVPYREYAAFVEWQKKIRAEMQNTDKAIAIAKEDLWGGLFKLFF